MRPIQTQKSPGNHPGFSLPTSCSLFPVPCSLFPVPYFLFPVPYRMYRLKSWSFTTLATICFTYSSVMRKTFSGPEAVMRSS